MSVSRCDTHNHPFFALTSSSTKCAFARPITHFVLDDAGSKNGETELGAEIREGDEVR